MNEADWVIVAVISVSTLFGLFRGLVRELISLVGVLVAGGIALRASPSVQAWLEPYLTLPSLRAAVAFLAVLIAVLLAASLLGRLLITMVKHAGLAPTDRVLGGVFGLARGLAIVILAVIVAGATPLPDDPWWDQSVLITQISPHADSVLNVMPSSVADYFRSTESESPIDSVFENGLNSLPQLD